MNLLDVLGKGDKMWGFAEQFIAIRNEFDKFRLYRNTNVRFHFITCH